MRISIIFVSLLMSLSMLVTAEGRKLVMKDGSTMDTVSMEIVKGHVQVRLPNGRFMAFDKTDIDLEASGLLPTMEEPRQNPEGISGSDGRFGRALAPRDGGEPSLKITDQDVKHVKPLEKSPDAEEEEAEDETTLLSVEIRDVQRSLRKGILTLAGTIVNTGYEDVEAVSILAEALDADNKTIGHGSTGIASTLKGGESQSFAIAMSVPGVVADVRIRARAMGQTPVAKTPETPKKREDEAQKNE